MCRVISVANIKGGVAKTTTAANLGIGLVKKGKRVLIIDLDPQGSLSLGLGIRNNKDLPYTVGTVIQKVINEIEISEGEGIIHNAEGVDILPSNHSLRAVEQQLDEVMSKELKPDYNGKTVIETDVCAFSIAEDELEKCKKTYDGKEAYSFYFGKYQIRSLYADCLDYRKNMARDEVTPHATNAGTQQAAYGKYSELFRLNDDVIRAVLFLFCVMEIIIRQETGGKEQHEKNIFAEAAGASLAVNITRG